MIFKIMASESESGFAFPPKTKRKAKALRITNFALRGMRNSTGGRWSKCMTSRASAGSRCGNILSVNGCSATQNAGTSKD